MKRLILPESGLSRRRFLTLGAGAALALVAGPVLSTPLLTPSARVTPDRGERRLAFVNLHTGETLKATYWQDGDYVTEELAAINHLLRDYRVNEVGMMAPQLLDKLHLLQQRLGSKQPYQVISGFRSAKTNAMLHRTTPGVATKSRHMLGQAIDVRLPGTGLKHLMQAAHGLRAGGVGYYPKSSFVHLDIGPFRTWNG